MELKIEEKLRDVLIPLTDEKFTALEEDILRNGCIQPIIIWNGTIVDGHNRYAICQKYGIPFKTVRRYVFAPAFCEKVECPAASGIKV